jgi:hypothetical protein
MFYPETGLLARFMATCVGSLGASMGFQKRRFGPFRFFCDSLFLPLSCGEFVLL